MPHSFIFIFGGWVSASDAGLCEIRDEIDARQILVHPVRPVPPSSGAVVASCGSFDLIDQWNTRVSRQVLDLDRIVFLEFADELKALEKADSRTEIADTKSETAGGDPEQGDETCYDGICGDTPVGPRKQFLQEAYDIGDGVHMNRVYLPLFATHMLQALDRRWQLVR